jgi:hypothetical protein
MPLNEVVRAYDLGFRPMPWGDKGYLPANLQPLGEIPPAVADKIGGDEANPFARAEQTIRRQSMNQKRVSESARRQSMNQ